MQRTNAGRPTSQSGGAPRVLLLTQAALPDLSPDDAPLKAAFAAAGWEVRPAIWSDPIPQADLAIVRSTWDYALRVGEFLTALDEVATRMVLWNPAPTVRWNSDKRYLLELAAAGVPLPEATVVRKGSGTDLGSVLSELAAEQVVVKPLVGAGGTRTWRTSRGDDAAWAAAVAAGDLLVQRYLPEVATAGEWSMVFIGGSYSHSVLKHPGAGDFRVQAQYGGTWRSAEPGAEVVAAAERVLAAIGHRWQYARIDGVVAGGGFLLMEAELIEPELFLPAAPGAAERLVAATT